MQSKVPFRFIYRTHRRDFKVVKLQVPEQHLIIEFANLGYDFILYPAYEPVPITSMSETQLRNYLNNRGWLYIGRYLPTLYEAADIERICRLGNVDQQQMYYNRIGEFKYLSKENESEKKIITKACSAIPGSIDPEADIFYF